MPRAFSPTEKTVLTARLLQVGREHFTRFGLKKTNVGELCDAIGIAKGSFYLFFETKELLFAAVLAEVEAEIRQKLLTELEARRADPRQMVRYLVESPLRLLAQEPLLNFLANPEEFQLLMSRMPPEVVHHNQEDDEAFFGKILASWQAEGILKPIPVPHITGALRAMLGLNLQRKLIGEEAFEPVLKLFVDGLMLQLMP